QQLSPHRNQQSRDQGGLTLSLFVLLIVGAFVLVTLAIRLGLHELCYLFDGDETYRASGRSVSSYWLTFNSADDLTFEQAKEGFHDRASNFPTLAAAEYYAAGVNTGRKAMGKR